MKPVQAKKRVFPGGKQKKRDPRQNKKTAEFHLVRALMKASQAQTKNKQDRQAGPQQPAEPHRLCSFPTHSGVVALHRCQGVFQEHSEIGNMLSSKTPRSQKRADEAANEVNANSPLAPDEEVSRQNDHCHSRNDQERHLHQGSSSGEKTKNHRA